MKTDNARALVHKTSGALATVYACPFCRRFSKVMRKGIPGVGRGYGLALGGAYSAQVAAHIRAEHPEKVTQKDTDA